MTDDPRVEQLLDKLLASHAAPEVVCASCPELLPVVRKRWRQMRRLCADLDFLFPPPDKPTPQPPERMALPCISGYEVETVLGRGGMGIVFRARHLRLNRLVALKMALAGAYAEPHERERFQREAEAVAALRHPNVAQVYDAGEADGRPYFTMEYVEGSSLAQKLAGTPQPARQAAALLATLAGAVQSAHQSGIVHRDLKPANVLLTADEIPKISDFGLARRLRPSGCPEPGLTPTGAAVGTPSYMAPEQARGNPGAAGPAADIYALGAILYELLTGRPPFRAETAVETLLQVVSQDPAPPSRLNARVPRDLETICLKCLHKEPRLRYAAAAALAEDLGRFLQGEAIAARPEGRFEKLARRIRRRPTFTAVLVGSTLIIAALLGSGLWLLAERAATEQQAKADQAATERFAAEDLREMDDWLRKSSWPEATAAFERARGRLENRGSADLQQHLDQGRRALALAARLAQIRRDRALMGHQAFKEYAEAFQQGGFGTVGDDPTVVAQQIAQSNIKQALIDALDDWATGIHNPDSARMEVWLLDVARKADPDPQGWRDRFRDPEVRKDKEKLLALAESIKVDSAPVNLLVGVGDLLLSRGGDAHGFLMKVQRRYPDDLFVNFRLGVIAKNPTDAIRYFQTALAIRPETPVLYHNLGRVTLWAGRREEAVYYCREAVRRDPDRAVFRAGLGICLKEVGQDREAARQLQKGLALNPDRLTLRSLQIGMRDLRLRQRRLEEARIAWRAAIATDPPPEDWYGYAELCAFLENEDQYRRARRALLWKFGSSGDPPIAERMGRACLLLPASGDELRQAAALAERAAAVPRPRAGNTYPFFQFVRGLADYRRGRFDRALSTMRGEASGVLGPAPRLVLAMALHRKGQTAEARKALTAAVVGHNWSQANVRDQDGWIYHTLRREAERMILPDLPAFLEGKYQPKDKDERLALTGVCQSLGRHRAAARLYADAFAVDPQLTVDFRVQYRYAAARAAAQAGRGRGSDAAGVEETERTRWRKQALQWLRADLTGWSGWLDVNPTAHRGIVRVVLTQWREDPDLACVRDRGELDKLAPDERKEYLALWADVTAVLARTKK